MRQLALLFLLIPLLAHAQEAPRVTEVVLTSTPAQLSRVLGSYYVGIQNLGPTAIYCGFTAAEAVDSKALKIAGSGGFASLTVHWTKKIYCVCPADDQVTTTATIVVET